MQHHDLPSGRLLPPLEGLPLERRNPLLQRHHPFVVPFRIRT
jgi:hypothetical protein